MKFRRTPLAIALVVLIGGLAASVIAATLWRDALRDDARSQFVAEARSVDADVDRRLDELAAVGRGTRDALVGEDLSPRVFARAGADAIADLPADVVAGVAYVVPVADAAGLDALRRDVRAGGLREFEVNDPVPGAEHLVATFEAPARGVRVLDGLDLARVPAAQAALDQARAEGRAVMSDRFERLPRAAIEAYPGLADSAVAVAVPIYVDGTVPVTSAERIESLEGWVLVVASPQRVLEQAVMVGGGDLAAQLVELEDPDAPSAAAGSIVASTERDDGGRPMALAEGEPDTVQQDAIERLGQRWELTIADLDGLGGATTREPVWILAGGAALSVLLAALVWSLADTRAVALARVDQATAEVRRTEARFQALVQNLPDLIVVTEDERTISYVSPSVTALLGWSTDDAAGADLVSAVHPDDRPRLAQLLADGASQIAAVRVRSANGHYRWFEGSVTDLYDDPAVEGLVVTAHDVTAQKAVEDRLAHQATHDPLTHLPNRLIVHDRLDHALARGRRDGSRAAAIFLDIDEFKAINDTWGHAAGDELLRQVASRVQRAARAADTVGRYGGDEFVVICEDLPSASEALVVAERIRDEVARPARIDGAEVQVGTSIGVALTARSDEGTGDLIGRADAAMYEAKARGRGRIVVDAAPTPLGEH